jgi:chorismate mutase/prephenate dehydrogenase
MEASMRRQDSPPAELLEQHRRDIETLDRRVLHLVRERLDLARQIGELKRSCGVPLRNFQVEAQVHRRFEDACADLGLEPGLGHDLALFLIERAVEEQAALMDSEYSGDQLRTLVVGGKGGMGSWIAKFLAGQGHRVSILDPAPSESPFREIEDLGQGAAEADLVVVAVPMGDMEDVLAEIAAVRPQAVVAEMCSLKTHLQPTMQRLRAGGLRLVSFHPMFGPDLRMLSGRTIVFCTDADPEDLALVRGLFEDTSAELVEMDVAEHDRRIALVLGLTHLSNLAYARALMGSRASAEDLAQVAGETYTKQLGTTREVIQENPELYFQIQALNPITEEVADGLINAVREWREAVVAGDNNGFARLMRECRDYLAGAADNGAEAGQ